MSQQTAQESLDAVRHEVEQIRIALKHVIGRYRENISDSLKRIEKHCDNAQREMSTVPYVAPLDNWQPYKSDLRHPHSSQVVIGMAAAKK